MFDSIPTTSNLLSAYATVSTFFMLLRTIFDQPVSKGVRDYISAKLPDFLAEYFSSDLTFTVENGVFNSTETFRAAEIYLPTRIGPSTRSLCLVSSINSESGTPETAIPVGGKVVDVFDEMQLTWTLEARQESKETLEIKYFKLTCKRQYKDKVLKTYLPHVISTAQTLVNKRKGLKIYTYDAVWQYWESSVFNHPASFETLAMEPNLKKSILEDLDMFVGRKDYFRRVGRAWKRGYLLYGPPGTGKSTLVAAIANYLRYNIYDLQFASVNSDYELRNILTTNTNRSILLIEDIDCSCEASHDRAESGGSNGRGRRKAKGVFVESMVTLSGLLNFIDGLWSSVGDERIIIFTTNHKDKLDPALVRPGRMDVHIYMGHCSPTAFRKLASLYLGVQDHKLFEVIEECIQEIKVTPAEVAQQLMASNVPEISLMSLIEFLRMKKNGNGNGHGESRATEEGGNRKDDDEEQKNRKKENAGWGKGEFDDRCIYLT